MLVNKALQFAVLTAVVLLESNTEAARTAAVKFCGRQLSEIMSRVCHAYNSPSWDVPTVEQPSGTVRRKRQLGIADECCIIGCTWDQLSEYCSIVSYAYSNSPQASDEDHVIEDRSAEQSGGGARSAPNAMPASTPVAVGSAGFLSAADEGGEGRARGRGQGYGRSRARGRRCWCHRKRRSGRRRSLLMGPRKKCSTRCSRRGHRVASYNMGKNTQHQRTAG